MPNHNYMFDTIKQKLEQLDFKLNETYSFKTSKYHLIGDLQIKHTKSYGMAFIISNHTLIWKAHNSNTMYIPTDIILTERALNYLSKPTKDELLLRTIDKII